MERRAAPEKGVPAGTGSLGFPCPRARIGKAGSPRAGCAPVRRSLYPLHPAASRDHRLHFGDRAVPFHRMQARRFPGLLPVLVLAVISVGCAPATGPDSRPAAAVLSQAPAATQAPQAKRSAAVVIAAAGDIACPGSPCDAERQTAGEIRRIDPDAVLALGDLQYPN